MARSTSFQRMWGMQSTKLKNNQQPISLGADPKRLWCRKNGQERCNVQNDCCQWFLSSLDWPFFAPQPFKVAVLLRYTCKMWTNPTWDNPSMIAPQRICKEIGPQRDCCNLISALLGPILGSNRPRSSKDLRKSSCTAGTSSAASCAGLLLRPNELSQIRSYQNVCVCMDL